MIAPTQAEFARAVAAVRNAPFGYALEVIQMNLSDAIEDCKVHMNGPLESRMVKEVCYWNEELRKWEAANEAAKALNKKDWVEAA